MSMQYILPHLGPHIELDMASVREALGCPHFAAQLPAQLAHISMYPPITPIYPYLPTTVRASPVHARINSSVHAGLLLVLAREVTPVYVYR